MNFSLYFSTYLKNIWNTCINKFSLWSWFTQYEIITICNIKELVYLENSEIAIAKKNIKKYDAKNIAHVNNITSKPFFAIFGLSSFRTRYITKPPTIPTKIGARYHNFELPFSVVGNDNIEYNLY